MTGDKLEHAPAPIILVPGFWLGAWAWDAVVASLREAGHDVTALTLPGLESIDTNRAAITLSHHVDAICNAVRAAADPVVLAVHSGAGAAGYAASDRVPELIAAVVYVDSGPATAALDPDFGGVELALPSWEELTSDPGNSLEGVSDEDLARFRSLAVPQPGGVVREAVMLSNPARLDILTVVICAAIPSDQIKKAVEAGVTWVGGLADLKHVVYVDLPTSHWPMWSRPNELAEIIGNVASEVADA